MLMCVTEPQNPDSPPVDPARQIVHDLLTHAGGIATTGGSPTSDVVAPLVIKMVEGGPEMQAAVVMVVTEFLARLVSGLAEEIQEPPADLVSALIHADWSRPA